MTCFHTCTNQPDRTPQTELRHGKEGRQYKRGQKNIQKRRAMRRAPATEGRSTSGVTEEWTERPARSRYYPWIRHNLVLRRVDYRVGNVPGRALGHGREHGHGGRRTDIAFARLDAAFVGDLVEAPCECGRRRTRQAFDRDGTGAMLLQDGLLPEVRTIQALGFWITTGPGHTRADLSMPGFAGARITRAFLGFS